MCCCVPDIATSGSGGDCPFRLLYQAKVLQVVPLPLPQYCARSVISEYGPWLIRFVDSLFIHDQMHNPPSHTTAISMPRVYICQHLDLAHKLLDAWLVQDWLGLITATQQSFNVRYSFERRNCITKIWKHTFGIIKQHHMMQLSEKVDISVVVSLAMWSTSGDQKPLMVCGISPYQMINKSNSRYVKLRLYQHHAMKERMPIN